MSEKPLKANLAEIEITPNEGGTVKSTDGKVTLQFPAGAVSTKATARLTLTTSRAPRGQFDWPPYSFDVDVRDPADKYIPNFAKPVILEVSYTDEDIRGLSAYTLALYIYDKQQKQWVKLPSKVDLDNRKVSATTTHFTEVGLWGDPFVTLPGMIKSFETDLYSGTASFSHPLEVIPGPNGLQPNLRLTYSSGSVEEMKSSKSRGSWVGVGWHLGLGSINYDPRENKFYMKLNDVTDELVLGSDGYYHTKKESFLRISKIEQGSSWSNVNNVYWEAWAKDGTYFRFGNKLDTNVNDLTDNGDGTHLGVDGSRHFYSDWGNDGQGNWGYTHTHYRWDVDLVRDTHGNSMTISYRGVSGFLHVSEAGSVSDRYGESSYPYEAKYSENDSGGARRRVRFLISPRHDVAQGVRTRETHRLNYVEVRLGLSAETLVRKYAFEYDTSDANQLRLSRVRRYGNDNATSLPPMEFTYENKEMRYHDPYNNYFEGYSQPRLVTAKNGFGGTVTFTYHEDPDPAANFKLGWSRQLIVTRTLEDGRGGSSLYSYSYQGQQDYKPAGKSWYEQEYRGYNIVTVTDPGGHVSHHRFHQGYVGNGDNNGGTLQTLTYEDGTTFQDGADLEGKPYEEDQHEGAGTALSRKRNVWSAITLPGGGSSIRFLRLDEFKEYQGAKQKRTTYSYDNYGNTSNIYEWGEQTSNWYRRTLRNHDVNTSAWIVDKVTQEVVYDQDSQWQRTVYYLYDRNTGLRQPPGTKGELWWVRKVSRQDGDRFYTIDTKYTYDIYGNRLTENNYTQEGYYDFIGGFTNENPGLGTARTTTFTYDATYHAYKMTETLPLVNGQSHTTTYEYDYGLGQVTRITDPNGAVTKHGYDALGRRIATWLPGDDPNQSGAATVTYRYLIASSLPLSVQIGRRKDGGGGSFGRRAYEWQIYDGLGRLIQTQSDFDRSSQVIRAVDVNEIRTACVNYGSSPGFNGVTASVDKIKASHFVGLRNSVQTLWNNAGLGTLSVWSSNVTPGGDSLFTTPTPIYGSDIVDLRGWLNLYESKQSLPLTNYANAGGTVIVVNKFYNNRGLLDKESVPHFRTPKVPGQFDSTDWSPSLNPTTSFYYDGLGRQTSRVRPDGKTFSTSYTDWETTTIDENNHKKKYTNDAFGRLVKVEEFSGTSQYTLAGTTQYFYNVADQLTNVTDAQNNQTVIEYDKLGRKTKMHDPDLCGSGNSWDASYWWNYDYDPIGTLKSQTDAKGQVLTFEYDELKRLRYRKNGATVLTEFVYDETSGGFAGYNGKGRRTTMIFGSNNVKTFYDGRGRVVKSEHTLDGTTYTVQTSYDDVDRISTITYPNGEVLTYRYGDHGLPVSLESSVKGSIARSAVYNRLSRLQSVVLGNGLTTSYQYWGVEYTPPAPANPNSNFGMLRSIATGAIQSLTYDEYDGVGSIKKIIDGRTSETITFGYDSLDRLISASAPINETYAYDSIGRWQSRTGVTYGYPGAGGIHPHAPSLVNGNVYSYDNNGNLMGTAGDGRTYSYDIQNKLTSVTENGPTILSFAYDGDGVLRTMVKSSQTIHYVTPDYRVNLTTGEVTVYYRVNGKNVAYRNNSDLHYTLTDHLSSTHGEASESQAEQAERRYLPFGGTRSVSGIGDIADEEGFTSQKRIDSGNGNARRELYNYGARWYLPGVGIFTQPDTIVPDHKNPQALNRYSYGYNNPVKYSDPTGHIAYTDEIYGSWDESGGSDDGGELPLDLWLDTGDGSSDGAGLEIVLPNWSSGYSPEITATTPLSGDMTYYEPLMIGGTQGIGITLSGGGFGAGGTVGFMLAVDEAGESGLLLFAGGGGYASLPSGSASVTMQTTNSHSLDQLAGWSSQTGGGFSSIGPGIGVAGSAEAVLMNDVMGVDINLGFGAGFPYENHSFMVHSWLIK